MKPRPFHLMTVECPLILLNADTRHGDHRLHPGWLLRVLRAQFIALQLKGPGLQALESRLDIHSLILKPLPIFNVLPACHRKPSSNGLWSSHRPLREMQIVEPDHSILSYILTSRSCNSSWSFGIHLDYSRGIISSTLWLLGSSFTLEWQWTSISLWLLMAPGVLPLFISELMGARVSLRLDTL